MFSLYPAAACIEPPTDVIWLLLLCYFVVWVQIGTRAWPSYVAIGAWPNWNHFSAFQTVSLTSRESNQNNWRIRPQYQTKILSFLRFTPNLQTTIECSCMITWPGNLISVGRVIHKLLSRKFFFFGRAIMLPKLRKFPKLSFFQLFFRKVFWNIFHTTRNILLMFHKKIQSIENFQLNRFQWGIKMT